MEVESALVDHPSVAEAAVIGRTHEIKGQAIAAFVTVKDGTHATSEFAGTLKDTSPKSWARSAAPTTSFSPPSCPKPGRQDHATAAARHRRRAAP
jgi:acetyl-CoA synthetase